MLLATWAPWYALFRNPWEAGAFQVDIERFGRMVRGRLRPGPTRLEINPRPEDVAAVVKNGKAAVDIECGPEHPDRPWTAKYAARARLRTIGLGNSDWALSYRWETSPAVRAAIGNLLQDKSITKVYQNGPYYDIPVLKRYSLPTNNYSDTRDKRKALSATSRLSLRYLASVYDDAPPWKEEDEDEDDKIVFTTDYAKLMTYNAWDCVETARVDDAMSAEPEWSTPRVQKLYEVFHRLSHIASEMHELGMFVDTDKRQELADSLLAEYERREQALLKAVAIPGFRCTPNDMRSLIYKRHATSQVSRFNLPDPIDPKLWSSESTIKVDQGALLMLYVDPGTPDDLRHFIDLYWQAEGVWKARSASVVSDRISQAIGDDGRLHPAWNSCGTDTGRFACRDPNVMTLSKAKEAATNLGGDLPNLRQMYRARPGYKLIEADFSQLELRVMAAVSSDEVLEAALATGDVYSADAREIFQLPSDFNVRKLKPAARQLAKTVHLGYQYGAGTDALYRQAVEVDRSLRYDAVALVHAGMKRRYSQTVAYWYEEQARVRETGYSESRILGQRRSYPREPPITEIANYPIQSTAADVANLALIRLDAQLSGASRDARIIGQFHDAFLLEVPDEESHLSPVRGLVRDCMEQQHDINGRKRSFPAELKEGYSWSDC